MESDVITLQDLFEFKVERVTPDRIVIGALEPTGLRPTFLHKFEKRGIELPVSLFSGNGSGPDFGRASAPMRIGPRQTLRPRNRGGCLARAARRRPATRLASSRPGTRSSRTGRSSSRCRESASLGERDVQVRENGETVADVSVAAAESTAGEDFGVVLVIDASNSMRGRAIADATAAARAFAAAPAPTQQLGIVTFNRRASRAASPDD